MGEAMVEAMVEVMEAMEAVGEPVSTR